MSIFLLIIIVLLIYMVSQNNIKTVNDYSPLSREEVNFFSSQIQSNLNSSGKLEPMQLGTMVYQQWILPNTESHEVFDPILMKGELLTLEESIKKIAEVKRLSGNRWSYVGV